MKTKASQEHCDILNAMIADQGKDELLCLFYGGSALVWFWSFGTISALLAVSLGALLYLALGAWYFLNALNYESMVRDYKLQNGILTKDVEWEESPVQRAGVIFMLPIVLLALVVSTMDFVVRKLD